MEGSSGFGGEGGLVLGFVSAQHQQVADAQKLEVEQEVFDLFVCESAAHHVGHGGQSVALADGRCHGHGAGPFAHAFALEESVGCFAVDVLTAVCGDVDVFGGELFQAVDGLEESFGAPAFLRGEHFEGEGGTGLLLYEVYYVHAFYGKSFFRRQIYENIWKQENETRKFIQKTRPDVMGLTSGRVSHYVRTCGMSRPERFFRVLALVCRLH